MRHTLKIVVVSILAIPGGCVAVARYIVVAVNHQIAANTLNQQLQLSDGTQLRVKGDPTEGPDSGRTWDISYRANSGWEEVGSWWGNEDGNVLACPVGSTANHTHGRPARFCSASQRCVEDVPDGNSWGLL